MLSLNCLFATYSLQGLSKPINFYVRKCTTRANLDLLRLVIAIVQKDYGSPDVFELQEVAKPEVKDNEVLVRVRAAALNAGDVFDAVGKTSDSSATRSLATNGVYLTVKGSTKEKAENLVFLRERLEAGEIRPVIDRRYPLEQIPEAHRYVEKGHKKGNVVITVASQGP